MMPVDYIVLAGAVALAFGAVLCIALARAWRMLWEIHNADKERERWRTKW